MLGDAGVGDGVAVAVPVLYGLLPLAEAVQGLPRVVVYLQRRLEVGGKKRRTDPGRSQSGPAVGTAVSIGPLIQ